MKLKTISLWEPWASLIRTGAKTYETRSWATSYRGPLLICASKTREEDYMLANADFQKGLYPLLSEPYNVNRIASMVTEEHLSFGKAVAIVELLDCVRTETVKFEKQSGQTAFDWSPLEKSFGDFSPGRFAWKLKRTNTAFTPFPVKGAQGLFDVEIPEGLI